MPKEKRTDEGYQPSKKNDGYQPDKKGYQPSQLPQNPKPPQGGTGESSRKTSKKN